MQDYMIEVKDVTSYFVNVTAKTQKEAEEIALDEVWSGRYDSVEEHPIYIARCEKTSD